MSKRLLCFGFVLVSLAIVPEGWARLGQQYQMALGNPDGASTNAASRTKFLINQRAQYAISYNDDTHQPNWVSWSYSLDDDGTQARTDYWQTEELLPAGYLKIGTASFGSTVNNGVTNSWDRGHMCPSADRTKDLTNNQVTFRMSNIIPQHANNNQGLWATFENYTRTLTSGGNEVLIITGPAQFNAATIANGMRIPGSVWKIAVVVPNASSTTPANQRLTTSARVIALLTPNIGYTNGLINDWKAYRTSVEQIEQVTGFNFFSEVDPAVATYLKNVVDTGTGPNSPTVITSFSPAAGSAGSSVTIQGFNFGTNPTVEFNGWPATVTASTSNSLSVTVPTGATTGPLTVTGSGGTDTSKDAFQVVAGSSPTLSLSGSSLSGLTAMQNSPGPSQFYNLSGASLTGNITVTAPANFEISMNNSVFGNSLVLTPEAGVLPDTPIYVRIQAGASPGAVAGTITHTGGGTAGVNLNVTGTVTSTAPQLTLSTTNLSGFTAVAGGAGPSKSFTVSGSYLTGNLNLSAPLNFEISFGASTGFTNNLVLVPTAGTLASTLVYVRIPSWAPVGAVSGSLSLAGGGTAGGSIALSGTVSATGSGGVSAILAQWTFENLSTPTTSSAFGPLAPELGLQSNSASLTGFHTATNTSYSIPSGNGSFKALNANQWTTNDHYQIKITTLGYQDLKLKFDQTSSSSGPAEFSLSYSTDGSSFISSTNQNYLVPKTNGTAVIWTNAISNSNPASTISLDLVSLAELNNRSEVYLRLRPRSSVSMTNGTVGTNGTSRLDNVIVEATAIANPVPVITSAPTAVATAYEAFSFTITAANSPTLFSASGLPAGLSLNATTGEITGTPTFLGETVIALKAGNANGDGTGTLTLTVLANPNAPVLGGPLSATGQIGVNFDYLIPASNSPTSFLSGSLPAGLVLNPVTGHISGVPTTAGTTAVPITIQNAFGTDNGTLSIQVLDPVLNLNPAELTGFSSAFGSASTSQAYLLSGSDLAGNITVQAPLNFEISDAAAGPYAGSLPLSPLNGSLLVTVYVRLSATADPGIQSGSVIHTGGGAIPKYLPLSGEVISPSPLLTLSTGQLPPFAALQGSASDRQVYSLSGVGLTGSVAVTAPEGFEISLNEETYAPSLSLSPVTGNLANVSLYLRLSATNPAGNFAGSVVHAGGGAAPQSLSVQGTVSPPAGPAILATSGGSAYAGSNSFSYTIQTDGSQTVTSFGATGLPAGMNVNSTNGLISGTPTTPGTYAVTLRATSAQGTSSVGYVLRVIAAGEQPSPPTVVINKYHNSTPDRVELLVTGDSVNGPPVDMRGMIFKDCNGNMASDYGGKYVFKDHPLWTNVKAGTLVVLAAGNTLAEDLDGTDFVLQVNLGNANYFKEESAGFDIGNTEMVMIKPAGMQPDGVAGAMHALAAGTAGAQYNAFTGSKVRSSLELSSARGYYCYVDNRTKKLTDFTTANNGILSTFESFGAANDGNNSTFINSLRALDQTGPVLTLLGTSPITVNPDSAYVDAGATAFDAGDNQSKAVTATSAVMTSQPGTYLVTYSAADSRGNIGQASRTVVVRSRANAWAQTFGFNDTNFNLGADPDGDGISNLAEYALGGNPTNPLAGALPAVTQSNDAGTNYLVLRYRVRTNDNAISVQPRRSTNLANTNSWTAVGNFQSTPASDQPNHEDRVIRVPIQGVSRSFLKLEISQTNSP